jgi:hypothetical protein
MSMMSMISRFGSSLVLYDYNGIIVSILDFVLFGHCETAAGGRGNL